MERILQKFIRTIYKFVTVPCKGGRLYFDINKNIIVGYYNRACLTEIPLGRSRRLLIMQLQNKMDGTMVKCGRTTGGVGQSRRTFIGPDHW